jgi:hypothetical protein
VGEVSFIYIYALSLFPSFSTQEELEDWSDEEAPEIEPFNLKAENEEGYFDRNGNYVENKMERVQEEWLDDYDEKWAKKVSWGGIKGRINGSIFDRQDLIFCYSSKQNKLNKQRFMLN